MNAIPENEIQKLIQELQVHQIELELQNNELLRLKQEAELVSEKYSELYHFAPSAYFTVSVHGKILELNLAAEKMLGLDKVHIYYKALSNFISPDSGMLFESFLKRVFITHSIEFCEVGINSFDKKQYTLYLAGIKKDGEEYCFISCMDISERKKLENDLIAARERAEESDRLKTAFLQNISHEIRSPLNSIKGFSQLLLKDNIDKAKLKKYAKIIDERSDDLLCIVNDLLDIAKIESGELRINLEECNLKTLMDDLKDQFTEAQTRLKKQHIHFEMNIIGLPEDTIFITDISRLKQILINLLTNAFKFTNSGKITGGCKLAGDKFVFFVSDTGVGIPADKQSLIFDRFVQLKQEPSESYGGTGLGLSIIKGLTTLLRGQIHLESEPGKGSTFFISFPYKNNPL